MTGEHDPVVPTEPQIPHTDPDEPLNCLAVNKLAHAAAHNGEMDRVTAVDIGFITTHPGDPGAENTYDVPARCGTCRSMGGLAVRDGRITDITRIGEWPLLTERCRLEAGRTILARLVSGEDEI